GLLVVLRAAEPAAPFRCHRANLPGITGRPYQRRKRRRKFLAAAGELPAPPRSARGAPRAPAYAPAGAASSSARGRIRASGRGSHQFHFPSSSIVAGTRTSRTSVASTAIATAFPRPSSLIDGTPVPTNTANTHTMISAALVIVRADAASPSATARSVDPVAAYRSRIRESRNTS